MNLAISFSGGKTSAFMTRWLLENKRDEYDEIIVTFANTGQEREETLEFVDRCDKDFGFGVVWLEAVVNPVLGKGTKHRIVDFKTASRNGEPFEDYIKKHGIPNQAFPKCTDELKLCPMRSYIRSLGWKNKDYQTAIGIRADEMDRVSARFVEQRLYYPLCWDVKMSKESIAHWWEQQSFNLNLKEHEGNCSWCWKKSKRKLLTLAQDNPELFEFPARMEATYGKVGAMHRKNPDKKARVFFRKHQSTQEILAESKLPFERFIEEQQLQIKGFDYDMDSAGGCSESCEVY
jgi:hypothetical protein